MKLIAKIKLLGFFGIAILAGPLGAYKQIDDMALVLEQVKALTASHECSHQTLAVFDIDDNLLMHNK